MEKMPQTPRELERMIIRLTRPVIAAQGSAMIAAICGELSLTPEQEKRIFERSRVIFETHLQDEIAAHGEKYLRLLRIRSLRENAQR